MTEKAAGTKIWCPFHRGVRLIWVSVLRGSTVTTQHEQFRHQFTDLDQKEHTFRAGGATCFMGFFMHVQTDLRNQTLLKFESDTVVCGKSRQRPRFSGYTNGTAGSSVLS